MINALATGARIPAIRKQRMLVHPKPRMQFLAIPFRKDPLLTIDAARLALTGYLLKDAEAHEAERFDEIGRRFDGFEHAFPSGQDKALVDLKVALTFWDAWIDARNHGWQPTAGIQPREWPVLARSIAADVGAGRPIADARVRRLFDTAAHGGLTERAQGVASRLRERDGQ